METNLHEIRFSGVEFAYETMSAPLLRNLTLHLPLGWTGVVGANGSGKTTLLKLAVGAYRPVAGSVHGPEESVYCAQRTDDPPPLLGSLLAAMDGAAWELKGRLGLEADWLKRWESLSHGERKRAQIAVALWLEPPVLAVDEPTNHIDAQARALLEGALRDYRGVGLLVSHDRDLLDRLCRQCLFLDPPGFTLRPGGYSQGIEQAAMEEESLRHAAEQARRRRDRLEREAVRRREAAARSDKRRSKRGLGKDNSERHKRNLARVSGKDGQSGRLLRQMDGRLEQAQQKAEEIRLKKTYDLGIWLGEGRSKRDVLLRLAAGVIDLGGGRTLEYPDLVMRPDDRVALSGPNGGGKSTLVRHLLRRLNIEAARLVYLPQEISAERARGILAEARSLPRAELGRMMTAVSRLGSRPHRLLESAEPSPGEIRKILLALGIARVPHLIVMDEPTNHLDLPSIECLEEALDGCPCGLLLVSHDERFLARLTATRWQIASDGWDAKLEVVG